MGYLHIENLYKNQDILLFKECYALEKVHGTSAHVSLTQERIRFFSGGVSQEQFEKLFDAASLQATYDKHVAKEIILYGEAYGGKCQGMSATYGKELRFIVFDVCINDSWLNVPAAVDVAHMFGQQFVPYRRVPTTIESLDAERDSRSEIAVLCGFTEDRPREGVVLRPLVEMTTNNGARVISKHKRPEFSERKTIPSIDPTKRQIMEQAAAIADEWAVPMRLTHVLDKLPGEKTIQRVPDVIAAMIEDVTREASGEIVDNKAVRKAIGSKTALMYKQWLDKSWRE